MHSPAPVVPEDVRLSLLSHAAGSGPLAVRTELHSCPTGGCPVDAALEPETTAPGGSSTQPQVW